MLKRFNVKNFLSFSCKEDGMSEEFSMLPGKVRNKSDHLYDDGTTKLLKFAAVYGANAAGKSNLVKAIQCMRSIVLNGSVEGYTEKYCRMDDDNQNKPSYFEVELILDGTCYAYGFEIILSQARFISEWLVELHSDNRATVLFERDVEHGSYLLSSNWNQKSLSTKLDVYAEDIADDPSTLFLFIMNQNKKNLYENYTEVQILQAVYQWFRDKLDINYPNRPISNYSYLAQTNKIEEICRLITAFGTGITDVKIMEVPIEEIPASERKKIVQTILPDIIRKRNEIIYNVNERYHQSLNDSEDEIKINITIRSNTEFFLISVDKDETIVCQTVKFCHGKNDALFRLSEESDGTVRLLDLLEVLLAGEGKTYVIDELDRCLHPSLTYKFVETFLRFAREKNIQLIVTTHESRLMDFDLLRRDEIWFVNKRDTGESDIYSLEEYNARFDQKIDKAYLEGRYGGVPVFNTIFPIGEE